MRLVGVEVFRRGNIASCLVPLHLRTQPTNVVLRVAKVHQLTLIRRFENRVADTLAMGDILKALPTTLATHATRAMHETAAGKSTNTVFMGNQLTDNFDSTRCLPFLISAQREGATYQEVKQMVAKHKELSSLLQSELLACKVSTRASTFRR